MEPVSQNSVSILSYLMSSGPTSQWWAGISSSLRQTSQTLRRENLKNIKLKVDYKSTTEVTRKAAFIEIEQYNSGREAEMANLATLNLNLKP